jgi:hypothetical protein
MHTSTYKGKRVFVRLKAGGQFVDKFLDTKSKYIIFEKFGKVSKREIASFTIYRNVIE